MDPHNCDDWAGDNHQPDEWQQHGKALTDLLQEAWGLDQNASSHFRRYDNEDVDGQDYNGWARWNKGNANAPQP